MPTIHFVHGLPGSGKTTFARRLASDVEAVLLNHDEVRVSLFGRNPPAEGFEECTRRIDEFLWCLAAKFLNHGVDVIFDHGYWTRASRDEARCRARTLGAEFQFYAMVCPDAIADSRVIARNDAKAPGILFIPPGALAIFRSRLEPMKGDEAFIEVYGIPPNQAPEPTPMSVTAAASAAAAPATGVAHL